MKGCDTIAQAIEKESGVVFGLPGESILGIYEALEGTDVINVLMRDESSCVHAADGFARASGRVGVCMATHGPGAMNTGLGIATAHKDGAPVVALVGQLPERELEGEVFQGLDAYRAYQSITKSSFRARDISKDLSRAFATARSPPPGPVFVEIPLDLLEGDAGPYEGKRTRRPGPKKEEVDTFLRALETAERPLVLLGGGIVSSGAVQEAREFMETTGLPVVTTMMGRGVVPEDHPLCLGPTGTRGTARANCAVKEADLLIVLGARMSDRTARHIPSGTRTFHVNIRGGDSTSDVGRFLKAVLPCLQKARFKGKTGPFQKCYLEGGFPWRGKEGTSYEAVREIYKVLEDETVVVDPGQYTAWALTLKKVRRPRELIFSGSFAPMGFALPAAVGVHFAGKRPVVITGDGSLSMSAHELATVRELDIPVVICLLNNRGYGIIGQRQEDLFGRRTHVDFRVPDFQKLADAYGIDSARVEPPGVKDQLPEALKSGEPFLLEIMVEKETIPMPY